MENTEKTTELTLLVESKGLELSEAEQIKQSYLPYFVQMGEIKELAKKINFENPRELDEKIARDLRLKTVKIRTGSELIKEERKRIHSLKASIEQDAWNLIKSTCLLDEELFFQVEKKSEIEEKKRKELLKSERFELLLEFTDQAQMYPLGDMTQDNFEQLLSGLKLAKEAKFEADKKYEAERIEKEKQDVEDREQMRLENIRMKKEREENERLASIEKEKQRKELEKAEALRKAEQEKADKILEVQRKESEKAKAENEAKIKKQREENERLEKELKDKKDAELLEKQKAEKAESDRLIAEKKAQKAPDKEKLKVFVSLFQCPQKPLGLAKDALEVENEIIQKFNSFKSWAEKLIENS